MRREQKNVRTDFHVQVQHFAVEDSGVDRGKAHSGHPVSGQDLLLQFRPTDPQKFQHALSSPQTLIDLLWIDGYYGLALKEIAIRYIATVVRILFLCSTKQQRLLHRGTVPRYLQLYVYQSFKFKLQNYKNILSHRKENEQKLEDRRTSFSSQIFFSSSQV